MLKAMVVLVAAIAVVSCEAETPSSDSENPRSAADVLASAIRGLRDADSGHFTYVLELIGGTKTTLMEHSGRYHLSAGTSEIVTETASTATLTNLLVEGTGYLNAPGWPDGLDVCWLVLDEDVLRAEVGVSVDLTAGPEVIAALDAAEADDFDADDPHVIVGSVGLAAAVHLLLSPRYALDLVGDVDGRVPARFELDDGILAGWSISGRDAAKAVASTADLDREMAAALTSVSLRIEYSDLGDPVQIEAPAADALMTSEQMESGEGCALMR